MAQTSDLVPTLSEDKVYYDNVLQQLDISTLRPL